MRKKPSNTFANTADRRLKYGDLNESGGVDVKTVFITGASSDIGLAVCRKYAAAGWRVIAHFRSERPELSDLADSYVAIEPVQLDFADTASLERSLKDDRDFFCRADVLINLAASLQDIPYDDVDADTILETMRVNLVPGMLLMQAMGPAMAERGWGRIVHASSIGVKFGGGQNSFAYSLSKHALEFIPSICRTWAEHGVLTNVVRVGVTDTRIHANIENKNLGKRAALIPMKRMATADEMAETLFWLGSEQNGYITGQVIAASGGE